jgi:hypothetical protein
VFLRNFADIALGRYQAVTCANAASDPAKDCRHGLI